MKNLKSLLIMLLDNGGALGAAFVVASNYNQKLKNMSLYLGTKFNKNQIEEILKVQYSKKLTFDYFYMKKSCLKPPQNTLLMEK